MKSDSSHTASLITHPLNIRYLTGFTGASPDEREAYLLKTDRLCVLFTSALYTEYAASLPGITYITEISRENPLSDGLLAVCEKEHIDHVEFEDTDITVAELRTLTAAVRPVTFTPLEHAIETIRIHKIPQELVYIQEACTLTDACFAHVKQTLKRGITESELAWTIESFFRHQDAENAFPPIVAFGEHTSQPHYMTGRSMLTDNSLILLDFGAKVHGYCSDMTRMMYAGTPDDDTRSAYKTLLHAQQQSVLAVQKGQRSGAYLDSLAQSVVTHAGYPAYPHSLGHGLGLAIHESPRLSATHDATLSPGMVVTIEPGIYISGTYGMRIEDTVLITNSGADVLTQSTKELVSVSL